MIRQISSLLRKFASNRITGSSSQMGSSKPQSMYANLSKAESSKELLKLMSEDLPFKYRVRALRSASFMLRKDPYDPLNHQLFLKSIEFAKEAIAEISSLNFIDFNNLMIFLSQRQKEMDLYIKDHKSAILNQLELLLENENPDSKTVLSASCSISRLGLNSKVLDEMLYQRLNDNSNVPLSSLSMLIEGYIPHTHKISVKLRGAISAKILSTPIEEFDTTSASCILKNLSVLGNFMTYNVFNAVFLKLLNLLTAKQDTLDINDILNINSFYSEKPNSNRNLLLISLQRLIEHLQKPIPKHLLIDVLKSINQLKPNHIVSIKEIEKLLSHKILDIFKDTENLKFTDFKMFLESYSEFNQTIPDELSNSLKEIFKSNIKLTYYTVSIKPLLKLGVSDLKPYISQENFIESMEGANPRNKLTSFEDFPKINQKYVSELKTILEARIMQEIQDPKLSMEYIDKFDALCQKDLHIEDQFIDRLAEKFLNDLKTDKTQTDQFVISKAFMLSAYNKDLASQVYQQRDLPNKQYMATNILNRFGYRVSAAQILNLVNSIPEPDHTLIQALIKLAPEHPTSNYLYKIIKYINTLKGSIVESSSFRFSFIEYLDICRDKDVRIAFPNFIKNLNDYLESLDNINLYNPIYMKTVSNLLSYGIYSNSDEFSRKLIKKLFTIHMPAPNEPVSNEFMEIAVQYVNKDRDFDAAEKLLPSFLKLEGNITLSKLYLKIHTYVKWPRFEDALEKELVESVYSKLSSYRSCNNADYIKLLNKFRNTNFNNHFLLREKIFNALETQINILLPKFSKDILFEVLKEYTQFKNLKSDNFYKTFLEVISTRYEKLTPDDKVTILEEFAKRGYINQDILQTIANDIVNYPDRFLSNTSKILASFCSLNIEQEPWGQATFDILLQNAQDKNLKFKNPDVFFDIIFALVKAKRSTEEITSAVENFNSLNHRYTPNFRKALLNNHFEINPIGVKLKRTQHEDNLLNANYFGDLFGSRGLKYLTLSKLLHKHKVEYTTSAIKDNVFIPIYIPRANTAIWIPGSRENTYDSSRLKGEFDLHKQHIQAKVNNLVIMNTSTFNEMKEEDLNKWLETLQLKQ